MPNANCDKSLAKKGYPPAVACQHFVNGDYSRAVDVCLSFIEKESENISARLIMARSYYHAGDSQKAREEFIKILGMDSDNLTAMKYIGDILFQEAHEVSAFTYYRKVIEIDSYTGGLYCPIEKVERSYTKKLIVKRPKQKSSGQKKTDNVQQPAFITETVGDIYRQQGYYKLAREVYRRLLTGEENNRISKKLKDVEAKLSEKE